MSARWLFIVNRAAGNGTGEEAWQLVEKSLRESGTPYLVEFPPTIEAASRLIHLRAVESIQGVVAVGGDGTLHSVVNGVMAITEAGGGQLPVGVIPVGQVNDFAHNFALPLHKPLAALRQILTFAKPHPVDVGVMTSSALAQPIYFANGVLLGLEPEDAERRAEGQRRRLLATVDFWRRYAPPTLTVTYGDIARTQPITLLAFTNGVRHLGIFRFAPDATPDDGAMELTLIRSVSRFTASRLLTRAANGALLPHVAVTQERVATVTLRSDTPIPMLMDGESLNLPLHDIELGIRAAGLLLMV